MSNDAFLSSLKVEPQALMAFSMDSIKSFQEAIKPAMDSFSKLGLKVGGSGLPGAAQLANNNAVVVHRNSAHLMKLGEGSEALAVASQAIAVIYQNSDLSAADEMGAVHDTFYPAAGTPTLEQSRADAAQQQQEEQDAIDDEILAEASQTSLEENGSSATAPVTNDENVCVPVDPMSVEGAQELVQEQQDYAGGFSPYHTYAASSETPMHLRDDVTGGENIPAPVTPYYGYGYGHPTGYYATGYPSSSYQASYYGQTYSAAAPSSSGYPAAAQAAAAQQTPSATTSANSSTSTSSAAPTSAPASSSQQDDEEPTSGTSAFAPVVAT